MPKVEKLRKKIGRILKEEKYRKMAELAEIE